MKMTIAIKKETKNMVAMKKFQLEFKFRDDHVVRQGCARVTHDNAQEAQDMLTKAMNLTVTDASDAKFLEVGQEHGDEHYPKHHVHITIGIGGGATCSKQISKDVLSADHKPTL